MSDLQQERFLLILAPIAGDVIKQDETAVYLAHIRAAADDGGIVRYTDMNVIGITRLYLFPDAEIRLTVQSVSYENRGTNTVHIPTKQG